MNLDYQRFIFRRIYQKDNEDFEHFIERIYKQMRKCSFEDNASQIRDQIIENCSIDQLRQEAFKRYLSVYQVISFGINYERIEKRSRGDFSESYAFCTRCGYKTHNQHSWRCPAMHHHCKRCSKKGHFEQMCLSSDEFSSAKKRSACENISHEREEKINIVSDPLTKKLSDSLQKKQDGLTKAITNTKIQVKTNINDPPAQNEKMSGQIVANDKKNLDVSQKKDDASSKKLSIAPTIPTKEQFSKQKSDIKAFENKIPPSNEKSSLTEITTPSFNKSFNQKEEKNPNISRPSVMTPETSLSLNKDFSRSSQKSELAAGKSYLGKTTTLPSLERTAHKSSALVKSRIKNSVISEDKKEPAEEAPSKVSSRNSFVKKSIQISTVESIAVELFEIFDETLHNFDPDESSQKHLTTEISTPTYFEAIEM